MKTKINKTNIIKNIFANKLYLIMLFGSIFISSILLFTAKQIIVPSFYDQMINNTLEDAKKVGQHIARHQNNNVKSALFYTTIDKLKDDFSIVKIRLFDTKGKIVFSTKTSEIGQVKDNDYYFNVVAKGEMYYKVVKKGSQSYDGVKFTRDVAEIYVPIMDNNTFKGSSEIYYDITDKKENFEKLIGKVNIFYYIFSFLFILVSFFVIYVLSKNNLKELNIEYDLMEKVEQKTQELQEINTNLEHRIKQEVEKNRERESQLFQQSKLASMGEMIKNIAHQWRQPLSAITSNASSLKLNNQLGILDDDEIDKKMDGIITKANFLSTTIENFRNFFKTDNEKKEFNLIETINKVKNITDSNYKNENIKIIDHFSNDTILIKSLEGELSQVILNILNNAYDNFITKDIENKIVKISVTLENQLIKIKIVDNGGGIHEDIISKIFEPYFTTKHQSQGTGIGLYMCLDIIQKHLKGTLIASNEEIEHNGLKYKGAAFLISFNATQL